MKWDGKFGFDTVSEDGKIVFVELVSTGAAKTAGGRNAIAKFKKLKADALYFLHVIGAERLIMVLTEKSMLEHFGKEMANGRFPPEIELIHASLPYDIHEIVL